MIQTAMSLSRAEEYKQAIAGLSESAEADIFLCNSAIERDLDDRIISLCHSRRRRPNALLVLVTGGGNPDVAYRISRTLQLAYDRFSCLVSGYCKSAGTLLALGAHELIFGNHGELGPLDVQMAKKDELLESESGLTVMTALTALHEKAMLAFEHFFLQTTVRGAGRITVRTASNIATELTRALFSPISDQIDPLHVGEAWRSMSVAKAYGERLIEKSKNSTTEKLEGLISNYPAHSFVLDRIEAEGIFEHVREANEAERRLIRALGSVAIRPSEKSIAAVLTEEVKEIQVKDDDREDERKEPDLAVAAEAGGDA